MGKKRKKKTRKNNNTKKMATAPKRRSKYPVMVLALGIALIGIGIYFLYPERASQRPVERTNSGIKEHFKRRETRATLPPALFTGRVRKAYQIARDIPEVLDQLYCYCMCKENSGHKSLLTCYVDNHAAT